jgi:hypothetical protein
MLTFNNDAALKARNITFAEKLCPRVGDSDKHRTREKLFWSSRQWCEAGYVCQKGPDCDHRFSADEIGIPVSIAYAERALFLDLPTEQAKLWMPRFLRSIPVGVDLESAGTWTKLALDVLAHPVHGLLNFARERDQYEAVSVVIGLFDIDCRDEATWEKAADACMRAHNKSPNNNGRLNSAESLNHAGCMACYSASFFARSFKDQRNAARAISWSGWALRYHTAGHYIDRAERSYKTRYHTSEVGIFSGIGIANDADGAGERTRAAHNVRVADSLIRVLQEAAPGNIMQRLVRRTIERVKRAA